MNVPPGEPAGAAAAQETRARKANTARISVMDPKEAVIVLGRLWLDVAQSHILIAIPFDSKRLALFATEKCIYSMTI